MSKRKKPPHLTSESFAEQQIREAQHAGKFDNLPGFGRPLPLMDEPYDPLWWVKRKSRQENLSMLPPSLAIRVDVERTFEHIAELSHEDNVRRCLEQLNERIRQANLRSAWGPPSTTSPVDIDDAVETWKQSQRYSD